MLLNRNDSGHSIMHSADQFIRWHGNDAERPLPLPALIAPVLPNARDAKLAHRVPFVVADLGPDVDPFILHLFAALAEKERKVISTRHSAGAPGKHDSERVPFRLEISGFPWESPTFKILVKPQGSSRTATRRVRSPEWDPYRTKTVKLGPLFLAQLRTTRVKFHNSMVG
jgi:hypothetical protein